MKYLKQFFLIMFFSCIGELLHFIIPIPIPASIYGLVLLFFALLLGVIKLEQVETTALFLIEIMPIMFVPAAVGLIESFDALQPILLPVIVIMVVSTILVMGISGRITQGIIHRKQKGQEK